MSTHYLIDFENVHENGLTRLRDRLEEQDTVHLLFTDNSPKIGLDSIAELRATLRIIKVGAGKQSLDMHLVSILGYLIAENGRDMNYVIVSIDSDFDGVIRFWTKRGYQVSRLSVVPVKQMKALPAPKQKELPNAKPRELSGPQQGELNGEKTAENGEAVSEAAVNSVSEANEGTGESRETQQQTSPSRSRSRRNRRSGSRNRNRNGRAAAAETSADAAQINTEAPAQNEGADNHTDPEPESAAESIGAENAAENSGAEPQAIEAAQPAENPAAAAEAERPSETADLNAKIRELYPEEDADDETCGEIASIVGRFIDQKNGKYTIYREIIKKFGQKKGLEFYKIMKNKI